MKPTELAEQIEIEFEAGKQAVDVRQSERYRGHGKRQVVTSLGQL